MEILKRITGLLTPPPKSITSKPRAVPLVDPPPDLAASIRPHLRCLASAESLDDPKVKECLAELKQLATKRGLYVTAFEVKNQLDLLPRTNEDGAVYHRSRGYVLAADFFLGHIRQEIEEMKNQRRAVGPNIFRGYCNEMVGCLLQGENPRRAVEIPMLVVEELLSGAVENTGRREVFLELCAQTAACALEAVRECVTQQSGRFGAKSSPNAATDTTLRRQRSNSGLDETVVRYLADVKRQLDEVRAVYSKAPSASGTGNGLEALTALLKLSGPSVFMPFAAMVCERIGLYMEANNPDEAARYLQSAGESFEAMGDYERGLLLSKLAVIRYRRSLDLYQRANAQQSAAQVESKLAELLTAKT